MNADLKRLEQTFGAPDVAWIIHRLRHRLEAGLDVQKRLKLREPSSSQREALARLLGRRMPLHGPLSVRPIHLEAMIRHAGLATSLIDAIEALSGGIENKAAKRVDEDNAWAEMFNEIEATLRGMPEALDWINELANSGLVRRLAKQNIEQGRVLCSRAAQIARQLPASGAYLAEIAALAAGDGHALDPGRPLSAIMLRLVAKLSGIEDCGTAEGRRTAWAGVGILVDELSAPVLTLNLRSEGTSSIDRALNLHAEMGEPYRITTRQLLRNRFRLSKSSVGSRVYVCENPTVIAAAANTLETKSSPMICIEGQPKTAAHILFFVLRRAGIDIAYHGDFDWPGIQIANLMIRRYAASPWRLGALDYENSPPGIGLKGKIVTACWDQDLATKMIQRQCAIHEEAVLPLLLKDLDMSGR
jgi:uncharacterized protein (TIGR02679 family)